MFMDGIKRFKSSIYLLIFFSILTGVIYPLIVTIIAQLFFSWKANGSLIIVNDKLIGSALIGQHVEDPRYFWGRPSATTPYPYNAANSSGSNMGPSNGNFLKSVKERVDRLHQANPQNKNLVPVDLVTASGSGLDPDISPYAAVYQVSRVAKANHLPENDLLELINTLKKHRTFHLLGEQRINVMELNMALDALRTANARPPT